MLLAEDHVPLGAFKRAPLTDAPLQGPAHALTQLWMPTDHLVEYADRPDAGCGHEHRHDLGFPQMGERIRTPALTRRLSLRGQARIGFDPIACRAAEPGHRGGDGWGTGLTGLHEQPHLAVGDVLASQAVILLW